MKNLKEEYEITKQTSKFLINKLSELNDENVNTESFIKDTLHHFELVINASENMAKELPNNSVAKYRYLKLKELLNIK
jgi:hypothetical protein